MHDLPNAQLLHVDKIWDSAPHNAFPDLIRYRNKWFCTFREGISHVGGGDGTLRILVSEDAVKWSSAAYIKMKNVDLRDPHLSITPEGKLMLNAGGAFYDDEKYRGRASYVYFSDNGMHWSDPSPIGEEHDWIWRITWHEGIAYGVSYRFSEPLNERSEWLLTLFSSHDGVHFTKIVPLDVPNRPNETTIRFLPSGEMIALCRRNGDNGYCWLGRSKRPYQRWNWTELDQSLGGPNFLILPNGEWIAGGRTIIREQGETRYTTTLGSLSPAEYDPLLTLPSGGDTSYPGLFYHEHALWVAYYSSHEGTTAIYFAVVDIK